MEVEAARAVTSKIWKGGQEALETFAERGGGEIIIWCPNNKEGMGRIAGAVVKAIEKGVQCKVTLVIPLVP